ncbi:carbon-nitrogen family hydrolase [uncultured Thermanaerothrix sp.]|uniref:carbon-nitrogen family hydrolase n=1 Tax=uncultured Thermanaerothrix sp. TaxID=1195149 RepID=UPI00260CA652|nr:carbon-nitrogen family hydrolase [uncultured Thermanaerothrix sp.]
MELNISLAQMNIQLGNLEKNYLKALEFLKEARKSHAHLVLFPELWSSGYDLKNQAQHAHQNLELISELRRQAQENGLYIGGSLITYDAGHYYNTFILIAPSGQITGQYHKIHLFGPLNEDRYFAPGHSPVLASVADLTSGLAICYDLRFPELFRAYLNHNADSFLLVAQWPAPRLEHWETLLRARAIENLALVAACNAVGTTGKVTNGGSSLIISPWGEVLARGSIREEDFVQATIDLANISEVRSNFPALQDRQEVHFTVRH